MIKIANLARRTRAIILFLSLALIFGWNLALSSRRQAYEGKVIRVERQDVKVSVASSGRVEPLIQEIVRSTLHGEKLAVHVNEGDRVTAGQLLVEISDELVRYDVQQKQVAYENSQNDLAKAKKDFDLARRLYRQGAIPQREVEDARHGLARAQQAGVLAKEDLEFIKKKASGAKVTSPIDGIVLEIFIRDKDFISDKQDLIKVAEPSKFVVRTYVDELDITRIQPGQAAVIACDAFRPTKLEGIVQRVGAQAKDGAFAEVEVLIDIVDTKGLELKPNLTCQVDIVTGDLPQALVIPLKSVRYDAQRTFVYRVRWGGWLESRSVKVTPLSNNRAVITEGLSEGEPILVPIEKKR